MIVCHNKEMAKKRKNKYISVKEIKDGMLFKIRDKICCAFEDAYLADRPDNVYDDNLEKSYLYHVKIISEHYGAGLLMGIECINEEGGLYSSTYLEIGDASFDCFDIETI